MLRGRLAAAEYHHDQTTASQVLGTPVAAEVSTERQQCLGQGDRDGQGSVTGKTCDPDQGTKKMG